MASRLRWKCDNRSHLTRASDFMHVVARGGNADVLPLRTWCALFQCDECHWPSIGFIQLHGDGNYAERYIGGPDPDIAWLPVQAVGRDFPDVPEHIASAASEAYVCQSVRAYRAAGSMARSVVEATAKEKGIVSGNLVSKIDEMENRRLIREHIKVAAHEVRHLGNDMAHGDFINPASEKETAEVLELILGQTCGTSSLDSRLHLEDLLNFDGITRLLSSGAAIEPTDEQRSRVVQRGLGKRAPFHRNRNSVADALLIELYASAVATADLDSDPHRFVTSTPDDFSLAVGDKRLPHQDLADSFSASGSNYWLGVDGLYSAFSEAFGDLYQQLLTESDFREEPRRLDEVLQAESGFFDRIWYQRSLSHEYQLENAERQRHTAIAAQGRRRVEELFGGPQNLGPYNDFEWGMLNAKLSALRWVLGSEWDFLVT